MVSVSVKKCIRGWRRSVRHINWQTGTAVSEVDTSNLLLQKRMPPPECASLISNLVLISSCCPLRRIRWQVVFEEAFPLPLLSLSFSFSAVKNKGGGREGGWNFIPFGKQCKCSGEVEMELQQQFMIWSSLVCDRFVFLRWEEHSRALYFYQLSDLQGITRMSNWRSSSLDMVVLW